MAEAQEELGGVITLPNSGLKPRKTPCALTKKTLENPKVQEGIASIKVQAKNTLTDLNVGETGHKEMNDGTIVQATPVNNGHSIDFGNKSNSKGAHHNHTLTGIRMHSPADINELLGFAVAQPTCTGNNTGNAYFGMIGAVHCATCPPDNVKYIHYIIRFNGTYQQAINYMFDDDVELAYERVYRETYDELSGNILPNGGPNPYVNSTGGINNQGLEKLFFDFLKKINFDRNHFVLQRVEQDGAINTITPDDPNNTTTTATPCI